MSILRFVGLCCIWLVVFGCQRAGSSPVLQQAPPELAPLSAPATGEFDLLLDPATLTATHAPVRKAAAIGDEYLLDLVPVIKPFCRDCFTVKRISRTPQGEIALDFRLRHPFAVDFPKKQYDLFDVRLILLAPYGDEAFNDTPPGPNGIITTVAKLVPNAVGYTTHYTERNPNIFRGTVNPFITFFTEDNPDPLLTGAPIAEHRMSYGQTDDQRMLLALPNTDPLRLRLILEASYVEAADKRSPELPGGAQNPVFFLPEGHQDEPYDVQVVVTGVSPHAGVPTSLTFTITALDWQAGAALDFSYPDLANPMGLNPARGLGDLTGVTLEFPAILLYDDTPTTVSGVGTLASPRIWTFVVPFETTAIGRFPFLVTVGDQRQPADFTGLTSLADLRAFRIGWVDVLP